MAVKIRQEINLTNVTADPVDSVEASYGGGGIAKIDPTNYNGKTAYFDDASLKVVPITGDFEPDGDVDYNDFALFAQHWLTVAGDQAFDALYDISNPKNDAIDIFDLVSLAENWLKTE